MKKFLLTGVLLMGAVSLASADDFSFSLSFSDNDRGWRPRRAYCAQPVYYGPVYRNYAYRPVRGYRPGYYYRHGCWVPRRNYVVVRSCD